MEETDEIVDQLHTVIGTVINVVNLAKIDYQETIVVLSCLIGSAAARFEDQANLEEILEDIKVSSVDALQSIKEDLQNG